MKTSTILLLVSDQLVRSVFQETLEHQGYVVLPTGDLGSAVIQLRQGDPDLLITRTYVSTMTGHEAAKYLRTKRPGLRVLIVGGLLVDDRLQVRDTLEHFDVFPKPYTAAQLLEKVKEVLARPSGA
jgi:DNA-binding response OmpR family regulator